MKIRFPYLFAIALLAGATLLSSFFKEHTTSFKEHTTSAPSISLPYKAAGLTSRQAAAHLLSRFTYGARPGEVEQVVAMGLEKWLKEQFNASLPDDSLNNLLSGYDALKLSNAELLKMYPRGGKALKMAVAEGVINKDSVSKGDRKNYREKLNAYMQEKGMRNRQDLMRQFISQKVLRAAYSHNQLQEMLTDFWFNHFNVSMTKNDCSEFIPDYERDVIRPNVLGKFNDLLLATAQSPAMLLYLDNFSSTGTNINMNKPVDGVRNKPAVIRRKKPMARVGGSPARIKNKKKSGGLNENYAREVMELHTLGVDGGYTQQDVTQAAKVLTGWTIFPMDDNPRNGIRKLIETGGEDKLRERGFVHNHDFLFVPTRHDNREKIVLGKKFHAGGGYEEGVELLHLLAHHPSTAAFISRKLAVRFVSDNPPRSLIDKMAKTFVRKDGNIREVLITMVSSPEFWSKEALREKTKSPFELVISAVRGLNASIRQPYQVFNWINRMGQKMYYYQAPTGFPDKGQYWINTGSLLNRMNFGLAFASQRIPGIRLNLLALNNNHEPESSSAALLTFSKLIMPERDLDATVKRLTPLLNDPGLESKIDQAASKTAPPQMPPDGGMQMSDAGGMSQNVMNTDDAGSAVQTKPASFQKRAGKNKPGKNDGALAGGGNPQNAMLSQVVGIIIGSPEFQRR